MDSTEPSFRKAWTDRSFWALNGAQFLGAFNDNLFKQLVLLLCVNQLKEQGGPDLQSLAAALFAAPFVLLSGLAGMLADRYSKRSVILWCKVAEVCIVLCGMAALASGVLAASLAVVGLLGIHSAFFGPAKYGILPELLPKSELPRANGLVLMATFLAIIFGLAGAGASISFGRWMWQDQLWPVSVVCLVIAALGWCCAWGIRPLPAAAPELRIQAKGWFITPETLRLLRDRRDLLTCVIASSTFWFAAGMVYPPAINRVAKEQFLLDDLLTGFLAASTGVGIAIGCILGGWLSRRAVHPWLVRTGVWGLTACLALLAVPGTNLGKTLLGPWGAAAALIGVGIFAGLFSVPLQIYLQAQAPIEQKGRMIAALNLLNWIGIFGSAIFYGACDAVLKQLTWPPAALFGVAAAFFALLGMLYHPPHAELHEEVDG